MIDFKVINAGKCMICGKPIILLPSRNNNKLPNIFFCKTCLIKIEEERMTADRNQKKVREKQ